MACKPPWQKTLGDFFEEQESKQMPEDRKEMKADLCALKKWAREEDQDD